MLYNKRKFVQNFTVYFFMDLISCLSSNKITSMHLSCQLHQAHFNISFLYLVQFGWTGQFA